MAELKISSTADFEAWLEGKPREVLVTLVSRIALRFFPLVVEAAPLKDFDKTIVLPTLWATTLSWVSAEYPIQNKNNDFAQAAHAASRAASRAAIAAAVDVFVPAAPAIVAPAATIAHVARHAAILDATRVAHASTHASTPATTHAAVFWEALTEDCRWLESEGNEAAAALAAQPLWYDEWADWLKLAWLELVGLLLNADEGWKVWLNWYEARLRGYPTIMAPDDIVEKLDLNIALIDEKFWQGEPSALNAKMQDLIDKALAEAREREGDSSHTMRDFIRHLLENSNRPMSIEDVSDAFERAGDQHPPSSVRGRLNELTAEGEILRVDAGIYASLDYEAVQLPGQVPEQEPAAIRPVWQDKLLTLPDNPSANDFVGGSIEEALATLKSKIKSLASDLEKNETNIDSRLLVYLNELADNVPEQVPPQHEIFNFAHNEITLSNLSQKAQEEFSALSAAQFESLVWLFREVVDKFPEWRAFKKKPTEDSLSKEQAKDILELVENFLKDLASEAAKQFISPLLVTAFEHLTKILREKLEDPLRDFQIEIAFYAQDLLDSLANAFKSIAPELLEAFKEGAKDEVKKFARKLGQLVVKVPVVGGGVIMGKPLLVEAIAKFPKQLGWLKPYLELIPTLF